MRVTRRYLELRDPSLHRTRTLPERGKDAPPVYFDRLQHCSVTSYRRLHHLVGHDYHWRARTRWTDEKLAEHLAKPTVAVCVLMVDTAVAGFAELERHDDGAVEIQHFGLAKAFHGQGLGGYFLSRVVEEGWMMAGGASRVWLHTCTLDDPAALPNYLKRGFEQFREEEYEELL